MSDISTAEEMRYQADSTEPPAADRSKVRSHKRTRLVVSVLVLLASALGTGAYLRGLNRESTTDAQIEGRIVEIAPRVSGRVLRVLVQDNQLVEAGQVLVELERDDLEARVSAARAELAAERASKDSAIASARLTEELMLAKTDEAKSGLEHASLSVAAVRAQSQQAVLGVVSAAARYRLAQQDFARISSLVGADALPESELDSQDSALAEASAELDQARLRVLASDSTVGASKAGVRVARAQLAAATADQTRIEIARAAVALAAAREEGAVAALRLAELDLAHATICAPARGIVSQRSVEVGQLAAPERPLLTLVSPDDVWVVAAFKEDQIEHMQRGQPAEVHVDAYPSRSLRANLESIAGASGAKFAVLPPDNASGNFVKVVQRIPVMLRFDSALDLPLRPGLSVEVTVDTSAGH